MDKITPEIRSRNMSRIKAKNTKPEILLRKLLYAKGLKYRIHYPLQGKPDIVFVKNKIAVFVNGCFWHGHGCKVDHTSKSNSEFWKNKIKINKKRDATVQNALRHEGWKVFIVWECKVRRNPTNSLRPLLSKLKNI